MHRILVLIILVLTVSFVSSSEDEKTNIRSYEIDIEEKNINITGKPVKALTVGGGIPGPTIKARVGELLRVTFNNKMDTNSSIHWHGVLLPPEQDGVPYLNTKPIAAKGSHTFEFPITHAGTYWYHSHTGLQEQRGVYGSIVFEDPNETKNYDKDLVLVFSDWTDENPDKVMRNLKRDGDYYALKKDSVQSWDKVIAHGKLAIKSRLSGAWSRMGPMDLSDVGYDAFLVNGEINHALSSGKPGDRIRLRMINASASSYFNVEFSGGPMELISADGMDIQTQKVKRLSMAIAETWDAIITIPDSGVYEIRATANDGTGYASAFIGEGEKIFAPNIPRPNLFVQDHSQHGATGGKEMDHAEMDHAAMGHVMPTTKDNEVPDVIDYLNGYKPLKAVKDTSYPEDMPLRTVELNLTGNMERYIWSFNEKTLSESDRILIRKGERVQFRLVNSTMMNHPIHLHGHFFRVLNGQGDMSPLKHTVNVPSMETVVIEFAANEEADWFFHCHNLYHMKAGMTRVISYEKTGKADKKLISKLSTDNHWYKFADIAIASHMTEGRLWAVNNRYQVEVEWEAESSNKYEVEAKVERFFSRYLEGFIGYKQESHIETSPIHNETEVERVGIIGFNYVLPMLIEAEFRVDHKGQFRAGFGSELQLTNKMKGSWHWNSDNEYRVGVDYALKKNFSIIASHNSDYGTGVGLVLKF